jgi:YbgC/YbaW family acyl-CoA thioester hydrolase
MAQPAADMETREEVMFFDTDCGGIVHNLAYLRMIETCRTRLASTLGMDLPAMAAQQVFPVLVRTEIDYKRSAVLGDWLCIRGRLAEVSKARFWCGFEILREKDGSLLVTARQALALVQMPAGKPLRLPPLRATPPAPAPPQPSPPRAPASPATPPKSQYPLA